jgi:hypothetical protein
LALGIFLLSNNGYASETTDVCFSEQTTNQMIVELEKGRIDSKELEASIKVITEKDTQINICQDKIIAKDDLLTYCNNTVSEYQTLRDNDKKACDEKVKAAKPTLKEIILYTLGTFGGGVLFALILL